MNHGDPSSHMIILKAPTSDIQLATVADVIAKFCSLSTHDVDVGLCPTIKNIPCLASAIDSPEMSFRSPWPYA